MTTNARKKILVVEDEQSLRSVLRTRFEKEGFIVFEAHNGEAGLAMALDEKPDIILLDVIMPKMDGLDMLKKLRDDEWGKGAKVFMLTNVSGTEDLEQAIRLNTFEYFVKSDIKIEEVVSRVKEKLHL